MLTVCGFDGVSQTLNAVANLVGQGAIEKCHLDEWTVVGPLVL